jgi:hypothetical protein
MTKNKDGLLNNSLPSAQVHVRGGGGRMSDDIIVVMPRRAQGTHETWYSVYVPSCRARLESNNFVLKNKYDHN